MLRFLFRRPTGHVRLRTRLAAAIRSTRGATAIEYALIAGAVALAVVAAVTLIGERVSAAFQSVLG